MRGKVDEEASGSGDEEKRRGRVEERRGSEGDWGIGS